MILFSMVQLLGFKFTGVSFKQLNKLEATPTLSNGRLSSEGCSLDTTLIASNIELVLSHLKARRADSKIDDDVLKLKNLRAERNACIVEGDKAKNIRKTLSKDIGILMKQNKLDEVDAVKMQVEQANIQSAASDEKLAQIDEEIKKIFSVLPNLLDDR
jgi:seryl-tRNA synthetase